MRIIKPKVKVTHKWANVKKWLSINALILASAIQVSWMNLGPEMKAAIPQKAIGGITAVLMFLGIGGRVVKSEDSQPVETENNNPDA